jgi:hypothetical protein
MDASVHMLKSKVLTTLINGVKWDSLSGDNLKQILDNPKEAGEQFTLFLKNGGKVSIEETEEQKRIRKVSFDGPGFIV